MHTSLQVRHAWMACAVGFLCFGGQAIADPPSSTTDTPASAPTGSFFSSLKQALKQDLNYEVVRGHFDVGSAPDNHRFYCLVDTRTGKNDEYAVGGDIFIRPDGMTGIKAGAVSPDSCIKVEEQGMLVTAGYVLKLTSKANANSAAPSPSPRPPAEPNKSASSAERVDVAGIKLGMSPDQVRTLLKSKMLSDYYESTDSLGKSDPHNRFVSAIAAWTSVSADGESYEVVFTPVPGKERAMAIVHSTAYSVANALGEASLQTGLIKKYGGYAGPSDLSDAPTWRIQSGGSVLTGDSCSRRGIFGGLGKVEPKLQPRQSLALNTTPDEFRYQIEQCGVAIVTEDQVTAGGDGSGDHVVIRFTVTAYSPSIGLDGATAAGQLIQSSGSAVDKSQGQQPSTPNL